VKKGGDKKKGKKGDEKATEEKRGNAGARILLEKL
jgi:hypothetical protein